MYSLLELLQILSLCLAEVNGEKKFSVILLNLTQKWLLSGLLCAGQVWTLSSVPSEKVLLITVQDHVLGCLFGDLSLVFHGNKK